MEIKKRMDLVVKNLDISEMKYLIECLSVIVDVDFSVVANDEYEPYMITDILPIVCSRKGELKFG